MTAYYLTPSQQTQNPLAGVVFNYTSQPQLYLNQQAVDKKKNMTPAQQMKEALLKVNPSAEMMTRRRPQAGLQNDTSEYDGMGRKQFPNGDFYEGHFRKGKMEGKGVFVSARGDVYDGTFKNGFKHGKGVIRYRGGEGGYYEGDWVYNKIEGKGVMVDA